MSGRRAPDAPAGPRHLPGRPVRLTDGPLVLVQARGRRATPTLRTPLPVVYIHDETGAGVIDPDAEVRAGIRH
jgi:hypothetical protein